MPVHAVGVNADQRRGLPGQGGGSSEGLGRRVTGRLGGRVDLKWELQLQLLGRLSHGEDNPLARQALPPV